jgi:hypothetical protein
MKMTTDNQPKPYAAVLRWKDTSGAWVVQDYFATQQEAEAWIAQQRHDPTHYEWEVMKYD